MSNFPVKGSGVKPLSPSSTVSPKPRLSLSDVPPLPSPPSPDKFKSIPKSSEPEDLSSRVLSKSSSELQQQESRMKSSTSLSEMESKLSGDHFGQRLEEVISGSMTTDSLTGLERSEIKAKAKDLMGFILDKDKFALMGKIYGNRRGLSLELAKLVPSEGLTKREHMMRTTAVLEGLQSGLMDWVAQTQNTTPLQDLSFDEMNFMARTIETKFGMKADMVKDLFLQQAILDAKLGAQTTVKGFLDSYFRLGLKSEAPKTDKIESMKPRWSQVQVEHVEIPEVELTAQEALKRLSEVDSTGFKNDDYKEDIKVLFTSNQRYLEKGYKGAQEDADFERNLLFCLDKLSKGPDSEQRLKDFAQRLTEYGPQKGHGNCGDLLLPMAKNFVAEYAQQLAKDGSSQIDGLKESSFQQKLARRIHERLSGEIFLNKIYYQAEQTYRKDMEMDISLYDRDESAEFLMGLQHFYKQEGKLPGGDELGYDEHAEMALETIQEHKELFLDYFDHVAMQEMTESVKDMIKDSLIGMAENGGKEFSSFLELVAKANGHDGTDMFEDWLVGDSDKFQDELMKGATAVSSFVNKMDISDDVALKVLKQLKMVSPRESDFAPSFGD